MFFVSVCFLLTFCVYDSFLLLCAEVVCSYLLHSTVYLSILLLIDTRAILKYVSEYVLGHIF